MSLLLTYFTPCSSVSIVNFKHVIAGWLCTEIQHDGRIEKKFWKYCKEIFESEDKVSVDFDKTKCYEHFIKS